MVPTAWRLIGEDYTYQEDNDPKHGGERGCKIVKKWFVDNRVTRLEWPSQSPDLNPMENVWKRLNMNLATVKCTCSGFERKNSTRI